MIHHRFTGELPTIEPAHLLWTRQFRWFKYCWRRPVLYLLLFSFSCRIEIHIVNNPMILTKSTCNPVISVGWAWSQANETSSVSLFGVRWRFGVCATITTQLTNRKSSSSVVIGSSQLVISWSVSLSVSYQQTICLSLDLQLRHTEGHLVHLSSISFNSCR